MIHETAIIHPDAKIHESVVVGPYSIIGADVEIGEGTQVGSHVVINGPTRIGKENRIYAFASVGGDPQDKKFQGEVAYLEIGDRNIIREYCTLNRGTEHGGKYTRIGNDNLLMAYVHIAHDCIVGNNVVFSNNASLAGHVVVKDYVVMSGFSAAHQFTVIGEHSFVAATTVVIKDVLPFVLVSGDPAEPFGLNTVGLKRRGFTEETILSLKRAYKIVYRQGLTVGEALEKLLVMVSECPEIQLMINALNASERGIAR